MPLLNKSFLLQLLHPFSLCLRTFAVLLWPACVANLTTAFTMATPEKMVIVGAGPVGSLAALYAAQRGYQVEVYELRPGKQHDPAI